MGGDLLPEAQPRRGISLLSGAQQPPAQWEINTLPQKRSVSGRRSIRPRAMKPQPPRRVSFSRNPFLLP